jgi:glycosyltransferase involved in cell wall biosynthesis
MRILYISQYFPPEIGATQTRAYEMARNLVHAGHQVTMLTEFPNHPVGIIPAEYRGKYFERTNLEGIEVLRVWVKTSPTKNFRTRLFFYLSFMLNATLVGLIFTRRKYDLIYATSPPLFVGGAGIALSYWKRAPLVFEVRDLWPESAVTMGELKSRRFINWAYRFEAACYRRARKIIVTAQEIKDYLVDRGIPTEKVAIVRNGSNTDLFYRNPETRQRVRQALTMQDKFIALYAGLHGLAYDLDIIIEAAYLLREITDIHFLFIGDGPTKPGLQERIGKLGLGNVTFMSAQSYQEISAYFNAADVSLIPMKEPHIVGTLPIKIYDSMACQLPVIACGTGEIRTIICESKAGIALTPEDPQQLKDAILQLHSNPEQRAVYGSNGRQAVETQYTRQAQAQQLERILLGIK